MCSVPMYSWLKRWASWFARAMTLRARSVNRSNMSISCRPGGLSPGPSSRTKPLRRKKLYAFAENDQFSRDSRSRPAANQAFARPAAATEVFTLGRRPIGEYRRVRGMSTTLRSGSLAQHVSGAADVQSALIPGPVRAGANGLYGPMRDQVEAATVVSAVAVHRRCWSPGSESDSTCPLGCHMWHPN